jgi:hypothetical protein
VISMWVDTVFHDADFKEFTLCFLHLRIDIFFQCSYFCDGAGTVLSECCLIVSLI